MALGKEQMKLLYRNLVRADHFDKMMMNRIMQGKLIGFYHPGDGAMAAGVGASTFLGDNDILNPHHRAHGLGYAAGRGIDVGRYLAEHTGKVDGCCGGRSSFHWSFPEKKMYGASGFIGWHFCPVVGWGWASKAQGQPDGADGLRRRLLRPGRCPRGDAVRHELEAAYRLLLRKQRHGDSLHHLRYAPHAGHLQPGPGLRHAGGSDRRPGRIRRGRDRDRRPRTRPGRQGTDLCRGQDPAPARTRRGHPGPGAAPSPGTPSTSRN